MLQELALGSTGSRLTRRKALGLGAGGAEGRRRARLVSGGMADDGSYVGPGGGGEEAGELDFKSVMCEILQLICVCVCVVVQFICV